MPFVGVGEGEKRAENAITSRRKRIFSLIRRQKKFTAGIMKSVFTLKRENFFLGFVTKIISSGPLFFLRRRNFYFGFRQMVNVNPPSDPLDRFY